MDVTVVSVRADNFYEANSCHIDSKIDVDIVSAARSQFPRAHDRVLKLRNGRVCCKRKEPTTFTQD
ncbi:hypothetical protein HMPREF3214_01381 [Alloscardovia omnicolens]|nr:hypothetical protein HMPREF3214_01381 [Alloscardovia omnicolens]